MGPGHVTGLDARQVVRTDPAPGSRGFEPNYFPLIEFDEPDAAVAVHAGRRRTPRRGCGRGCARGRAPTGRRAPAPAARRAAAGVRIAAAGEVADGAARPGRQLGVGARAGHRRAPGDGRGAGIDHRHAARAQRLAAALPRGSCSPTPSTSPASCRRSSWGARPGSASRSRRPTRRASSPPGAAATRRHLARAARLPSWQFATGAGGDFESLALLLRPRPLPASVGRRPIDVSASGLALTPPLAPGPRSRSTVRCGR